MTPSIVGALLVLGAFTGVAAGLLGIGGGMLMVPFMSMVLDRIGVPHDEVVKVAIATSLTTIVFTSASSVRAHHARGAVRWDVVRALAPGILAGSLLGAQLAHAAPGRLLAAFFGLFVAWSALKMLVGRPPSPERGLPGTPGMVAAGGAIGRPGEPLTLVSLSGDITLEAGARSVDAQLVAMGGKVKFAGGVEIIGGIASKTLDL
ncbi:MAG TPA: sulfite exporter TauE/SafE family protein, partial [Burkholderiaceae bacterium]|nr:sulfite exporter TauE/SafE family protein [Burkholderiaceae bacterium]